MRSASLIFPTLAVFLSIFSSASFPVAASSSVDWGQVEDLETFGMQHVKGYQRVRFVDELGNPQKGVHGGYRLTRANPKPTGLENLSITFSERFDTDDAGEISVPCIEEGTTVSVYEKRYRVPTFVVRLGAANSSRDYLSFIDGVLVCRVEVLPEAVPMFVSQGKLTNTWFNFGSNVEYGIKLPVASAQIENPVEDVAVADVAIFVTEVLTPPECPITRDSAYGGRRVERGCWKVRIEARNGWEIARVAEDPPLGSPEVTEAVQSGYTSEFVMDCPKGGDVGKSVDLVSGYFFLHHTTLNRYGRLGLYLAEEKFLGKEGDFYGIIIRCSYRVQAASVNSLSLVKD